jgi:uncharacterized membrane protein SpoIIM required for sporulation
MIESLLDFSKMEEKPYLTFIWAIIVSSVAILISSQVRSLPGVDFGFFAVLFTIIPSVYFFTLLIKREERIEEKRIKQKKTSFWDRHEKDILILLFYFIGVTIAFSMWSFALPEDSFASQTGKINQIRGTGALTEPGMFNVIFMNNLQVMLIAFVFSLIFGAGAVFIIVWNASVLGVYIGQVSKFAWQIPIVSLTFLPHGIPEITGYIVSGLAGGLLSAAILRKKDTNTLKYISFDSLKLLLFGVLIIAIAAAIEVYI